MPAVGLEPIRKGAKHRIGAAFEKSVCNSVCIKASAGLLEQGFKFLFDIRIRNI